MASISLQHVSKRFVSGAPAVRDVQLEITHGELLVLVGPSGSGKSTVLRLIAGLEMPTSGRILIDGEEVTNVPPQRRDLAMVFQSYALYPHKTVRENLAFGLRVRGVEAIHIDERVREAAKTLGIEALLDRRPAELSGGQRQRVALGRAIVRSPRAFLFDEPLSNLDPLLRIQTRAELALLHRRLETTMVYVTHDQEEAMTLGTRIAVIHDGMLEQVAAPMDLYHRPANTFVARFIGSPTMNIWPCTVDRASGGVNVRANGFGWDDLPVGRLNRGRVLVGARPHDIDLTPIDASDATGRVEILEPLGATMLAHVRIEGSPDAYARIVVPWDSRMGIDGRVGFRVRRDRVHFFDDDSGRRLDEE